MRQRSRNIALLSTLVILVVGVSASAASAAIQFEWKVNGSPLGSGKSKQITGKAKASAPFVLHTSAGGASIEVTSSQVKVASYATILGGSPGAGEVGLTFEAVKVAKPANCGVKEIYYGGEEAGKIKTTVLRSEITEGAIGGAGNGKVDLLLTPKTAENPWAGFELTGASCALKGTFVTIKGSLLGEFATQKTEAVVQSLTVPAKTKEYRTAANAFHTAGLEYGANAVTLSGEAELELVSKEVFGAF